MVFATSSSFDKPSSLLPSVHGHEPGGCSSRRLLGFCALGHQGGLRKLEMGTPNEGKLA